MRLKLNKGGRPATLGGTIISLRGRGGEELLGNFLWHGIFYLLIGCPCFFLVDNSL